MLDTFPPVNYPMSELKTPEWKLRPHKISFRDLAEVSRMVHFKIVSGEWTSKEATSILDSYGINSYASTKIIDNAERSFSYLCLEKSSDNPSGFQSLVQLKKHQPSLFEVWNGCAIWKSPVDIDHVIDVIMHLLFLGVVKEQRNVIKQWMSVTRRMKGFNNFQKNTVILKSIENLNLCWCKVVSTESGTSTGWISENYLGFCRIIKWYYHSLLYYQQDKPYTDPDSPVETWLKEQCIQYLKMRGQGYTGSRDDLRKEIISLQSKVGGPPPIITYSGCSVFELHCCITSLLAMVSIAMTKEVKRTTVSSLDHSVKTYLSFFHVIHSSLLDKSTTRKK